VHACAILQNPKKSKEVKNRCNLAESPWESYGSERAVLLPLLITMAVAMTKKNTRTPTHTHEI
jgi:hypothetical protein